MDDGTRRAVKVRYQRPGSVDKTFLVYEVDPAGGFLVGLGGGKLDLYGMLPPVGERGSRIAVLSEGEKATDRLRAYLDERPDEGSIFVAVGSHGESSFRSDGARLAAQLAGFREVVAVVDRDVAGARWAEDFRKHAEARVRVRFVRSAVEAAGADLYDHLESGHALAELVPFAEAPTVEVIDAVPESVPPRALDEVVETVRRWMYLPDPRGLYAALGAYAANAQEGDPVWLLVVGASGTGKTEAVDTLKGLDGVHAVSTLTEASLLSGTAKKDKAKDSKGGLLREIGERGVLLVKDFTSILSMHRDARAGVLAALREIYDGSYTRHVGTDGGRTMAWSGRLGLVGCTTPIIDVHHAVLSSMGERFLFYRMPEVDRNALTRSALGHARNGARMRQEIAETVRGLLANVSAETEPAALSPERTEHLIALANYTAIARSAVERDGRSREIELVVGAEAPTRLAIGLSRLLGGMQSIGVDDATAWRTTVKVALDCIPAIRRKVLDTVAVGPTMNTSEVAERIAYPTTTTRRTLEDLHAYGLVDRELRGVGKADQWTLSGLAAGLRQTVPEMSEDVHTANVERASI